MNDDMTFYDSDIKIQCLVTCNAHVCAIHACFVCVCFTRMHVWDPRNACVGVSKCTCGYMGVCEGQKDR